MVSGTAPTGSNRYRYDAGGNRYWTGALAGETLRGSMIEGGRAVKGLLAPRREIKEVQARLGVLEDALSGVASHPVAVTIAPPAACTRRRRVSTTIGGCR